MYISWVFKYTKYTEVKVLLKSCKTVTYTKLTMTKFQDIASSESTAWYDKNMNQGEYSYHVTLLVRYKIGSPGIPLTTFYFDANITKLIPLKDMHMNFLLLPNANKKCVLQTIYITALQWRYPSIHFVKTITWPVVYCMVFYLSCLYRYIQLNFCNILLGQMERECKYVVVRTSATQTMASPSRGKFDLDLWSHHQKSMGFLLILFTTYMWSYWY